jgi:hypothetical protein
MDEERLFAHDFPQVLEEDVAEGIVIVEKKNAHAEPLWSCIT